MVTDDDVERIRPASLATIITCCAQPCRRQNFPGLSTVTSPMYRIIA